MYTAIFVDDAAVGCSLIASCAMAFPRTTELPHRTHGKQSPDVILSIGTLEYRGMIPSFPYGEMYRFGNSVICWLICEIFGILAGIGDPVLVGGNSRLLDG